MGTAVRWVQSFAAPAAIAAVIAGSVSLSIQWWSTKEARGREERTRLVETYLELMARQYPSKMTEFAVRNLASRYRVLVFGDGNVIRQLASAHQAQAGYVPRRDGLEAKSKPPCECKVLVDSQVQTWWETRQSDEIVRKSVRPFLTMRDLFRDKDPISEVEAMRLLCPAKGILCFGVCYVSHLIDCEKPTCDKPTGESGARDQ